MEEVQTLPPLPSDIVSHILHELHPCCWHAASRVCTAWRAAARLSWEGVAELSVAVVEGQTKAFFRRLDGSSTPALIPAGSFDHEGFMWLNLASEDEGELSIACLDRLLLALPRVQSLALRDVRLTGEARTGRDTLPEPEGADPTLALLVHLLSTCPLVEAVSLQACSGSALDAGAARGARGARRAPTFARLRALQITQMDGPEMAAARWLIGRMPRLRLLDLAWSDTDLGCLLCLPRAVECVNFVGCAAVGEARVRELVRSPLHSALVHISLPTGMPLTVALEICASVPALRTLASAGAYSDSAGPHISFHHAQLRTLNLSALLLNHACCLELACPSLAVLDLRQDVFVFGGVSGLLLRETPALEALDVRWNAQLALQPIAFMPKLRSALLEGCASLSAPMLYELVQSAPRIEELEMNECDGLRNEPAVFSLAFALALRSSPRLRYTLPSGVKGVGLDVPSSALAHDFP
ncbi:hypothetical protein KFE25_009419 [Diacronema lutheri]|uniref:F-box domain-containing protein n=2 Tax=Diacronema lutheri TaxID=2081491 RepID=A0A8J5XSQ4_DIALT|nr:hypothetical protein KFE25_009419 [Diacronema lutheri]